MVKLKGQSGWTELERLGGGQVWIPCIDTVPRKLGRLHWMMKRLTWSFPPFPSPPLAPCMMLADVTRCLQMQKDSIWFSKMTQDTAGCCLMLYDAGRCNQTLTNAVGFTRIQQDASGYCRMLSDAIRCWQIYPDAYRCIRILCRILSDAVRCWQM